MLCPKCKSKTRVYVTKHEPNNTVMRWRKCRECEFTFPTYELSAKELTKQIRR